MSVLVYIYFPSEISIYCMFARRRRHVSPWPIDTVSRLASPPPLSVTGWDSRVSAVLIQTGKNWLKSWRSHQSHIIQNLYRNKLASRFGGKIITGPKQTISPIARHPIHAGGSKTLTAAVESCKLECWVYVGIWSTSGLRSSDINLSAFLFQPKLFVGRRLEIPFHASPQPDLQMTFSHYCVSCFSYQAPDKYYH